jgi:hypothetical protein
MSTEDEIKRRFGQVITNPSAALLEVGAQNTELHAELADCYKELDRYRNALTTISKMEGPAAKIATLALGARSLNG